VTVVICWWCTLPTDKPTWLERPEHPQLDAADRTVALCPSCTDEWKEAEAG
jgi:hypothetical protein